MLEWLKRHAWKACDRQNWFASSNLALSAKNNLKGINQVPFFLCLIDNILSETLWQEEAKLDSVVGRGET